MEVPAPGRKVAGAACGDPGGPRPPVWTGECESAGATGSYCLSDHYSRLVSLLQRLLREQMVQVTVPVRVQSVCVCIWVRVHTCRLVEYMKGELIYKTSTPFQR